MRLAGAAGFRGPFDPELLSLLDSPYAATLLLRGLMDVAGVAVSDLTVDDEALWDEKFWRAED